MALVKCENVFVNYGNYEAVKNVSFEIDEGDYLCIVGANGSGKTTLVKALLGIVPIKSGNFFIDKTQTGYLSQQHNIERDFPATVFEIVVSGCLYKTPKQTAFDKIALLGLDEIKNKSFSELSGGQQQRVLLARALCAAKKLLVLDEPVTGLDPVVTDTFYSTIRSLNQKNGLSIIMVSHDVHRAVQNATHILHLNKSPIFFGRAAEYSKTDFYKNMSHVEVCETHLCNHCGSDCNASHI